MANKILETIGKAGNVTANIGADIAAIGGLKLDKKDLNLSGKSKNTDNNQKKTSAEIAKESAEKAKEMANKANQSNSADKAASGASDERLKEIFADCGCDDVVKVFSKIRTLDYKYNDEAKEVYPDGEKGVDDAEHIGISAQDLKKNPVTAATVKTDEETGFLNVDTRQLCLSNTAVLAEVCRRLETLESLIKFLRG